MRKINYLFILSALSPLLSSAQWNKNTSINTPVSVAAKGQTEIHIVTDNRGGAIIAWDDTRTSSKTNSDIFVQRMDKFGVAKWTANGIAVCNNNAEQKNVNVVESLNGSAIIIWEDERAGNRDIYAQKIDSSGKILWSINGVAVVNKLTNQQSPKIISDYKGGAIIVYEDSVNFYFDVYAQRINSAGIIQWGANGVAVCSANYQQINPKIDIDGSGGAFITWQDKRNSSDYDIYAQHLNSDGVASWKVNGVGICTAINTQSNPRIEPDGNNGAIIAWIDKRSAIDYNIYAQRINAAGNIQWASDGLLVCNAIGNQSALDMQYIGANGIMIAWKDFRSSNSQIYCQLVNLQGIPQLRTNGILLSQGKGAINPNVIAGGKGTSIIVWQDSLAGGWNIKTQKISSSGVIQAKSEIIVCNASDDQLNASNVSDGKGGAIFVWEDHRNTTNYDVYAHHLDSVELGDLFVNIAQVSKKSNVKCFPNPLMDGQRNLIIETDGVSEKQIHIFNSTGSIVWSGHTNETGKATIEAETFSNGYYFFKIESKMNSIVVGNFMVIK